MLKLLAVSALAATTLLAQYKTESAGAPPAEASAHAAALVKDGLKILKDDGSVAMELWLVAAEPTGGAAEANASLPGVPHGALIGVARFPNRHSDRRGQTIKPGVYTLRYSVYPVNGDHQGISPQRDFLILSLAAQDVDPAAKPAFDPLMTMSRKASGTPHPLCLSFWKDDASAAPGITVEHDVDQVLHLKLGSTPVALIVYGRHEG
jgi:hypothetical protein